MPRYIAFLRAINLGGNRVAKNDVLRQVFELLGFSGITTFFASGNVAFVARRSDVGRLETKIEERLRVVLGFDVPVFIRTSEELKEIANLANARRSQIVGDVDFNIILLKDELDESSRKGLMMLNANTDEFRIQGREIHWLRRKKPGKSLFSTMPLGKVLRG